MTVEENSFFLVRDGNRRCNRRRNTGGLVVGQELSHRLALILLTDQFPRCIYRDTPGAFAYDAKALSWCVTGLDQ